MKNILPLLFLFFNHHTHAQVNSVMPAEAKAFYQNAMESIKPGIKNLIEKNANKLTKRRVNVDSLIKELHKIPLLREGNEKDLEAITVLILVQTSRNADADLKDLVIHMRHSNSEKKNEEEDENCKNTAALIVENKSEMAQSISIMMKKLSGSAEMVMDKFK
jgi:hypothetical protein